MTTPEKKSGPGGPRADHDLRRPYDPEQFRDLAHRLVDDLADHLERSLSGEGGMKVLDWVGPEEMAERWPPTFSADGGADPLELFREVARQSIHLHHPHYIGHQVSPPVPLAMLGDLVASLLNNGNTIYEMSPVTTAMERAVVEWMAAQLGFGPEAGGVMTSGGSLGNLTAMLAARQAKAGFDMWDEGGHAGPPLCVLGSEEAHYSVARALQVMGWGSGGYRPVPTDGHYRLDPTALEAAFDQASAEGRRVVGVVAHAGSTATGSVDPLVAIADFCEDRDLWMHVDGAHGASVVLSEKYGQLVDGIERADSVVWDAHKMLAIPALATGVIYRRGSDAYDAFSEQASYLFAGDRQEEWFNLAHRTVECTKRAMSLKVYVALAVLGTRWFGEFVTATLDMARAFDEMLAETSDFESATPPETNIVCFRYLPARLVGREPALIDAFQGAVRQAVLEAGDFYIVQTRLPDGLHLRVTMSNPYTTGDDLRDLLEHIRTVAADLLD